MIKNGRDLIERGNMFRVVDLIIKKRNGGILTTEEIKFLINSYVEGSIPDYQMSSLLMAIYFNPLTKKEIQDFTMTMLESGDQVDLSEIKGIKVDKHSTGGVGDKTTLVVGPIVSAVGLKLAKMSGRGLGHSGGTLDKLESIPGLSVELTSEEFFKQVNEIGLAVIGQTANITPADKKLYALRDVTGTIESEGLIAGSIMSKKLASGADNIVLDVKVGNGAFMKDLASAKSLAKTMVTLGNSLDRQTVAVLTNMEQPLGSAVGNSLEVIEAIETLKGHGPEDFRELCVSLASEIILVSGLVENIETAKSKVLNVLSNGEALDKLRLMIKAQGGNENVIDNYDLFGTADEIIELTYENKEEVFVESIDTTMIGNASVVLGAGRSKKDDIVDPQVGILIHKKIGDKLTNGDVIATIHSNGKNTNTAIQMILDAYTMTNEEVSKQPVILDIVR